MLNKKLYTSIKPLIHSGANTNVCKHRHWFEDDFEARSLDFNVANEGGKLQVLGIGTLKISVVSPGGRVTILRVAKIAYAPGQKQNSIFLSMMNLQECLQGTGGRWEQLCFTLGQAKSWPLHQ
jgi:hypothetical protein